MSDDGITRRQVLASGGVASFLIGFLSANSPKGGSIAPPGNNEEPKTIDSDNIDMQIITANTLAEAEEQRTESEALLLAEDGVEVVY